LQQTQFQVQQIQLVSYILGETQLQDATYPRTRVGSLVSNSRFFLPIDPKRMKFFACL
jgi:hypothetical protein